jgi:hypothetical protein
MTRVTLSVMIREDMVRMFQAAENLLLNAVMPEDVLRDLDYCVAQPESVNY